MPDQPQELRAIASKLELGAYSRHVFLCMGPTCCDPLHGLAAWEALKKAIKDHGLVISCQRTKVGCLRGCSHGPVAVVYPEGTWYYGLSVDRIPRFVREHLVEGRPVDDWIFARNPLTSHSPEDRR